LQSIHPSRRRHKLPQTGGTYTGCGLWLQGRLYDWEVLKVEGKIVPAEEILEDREIKDTAPQYFLGLCPVVDQVRSKVTAYYNIIAGLYDLAVHEFYASGNFCLFKGDRGRCKPLKDNQKKYREHYSPPSVPDSIHSFENWSRGKVSIYFCFPSTLIPGLRLYRKAPGLSALLEKDVHGLKFAK
jgi:hypothetical protein